MEVFPMAMNLNTLLILMTQVCFWSPTENSKIITSKKSFQNTTKNRLTEVLVGSKAAKILMEVFQHLTVIKMMDSTNFGPLCFGWLRSTRALKFSTLHALILSVTFLKEWLHPISLTMTFSPEELIICSRTERMECGVPDGESIMFTQLEPYFQDCQKLATTWASLGSPI